MNQNHKKIVKNIFKGKEATSIWGTRGSNGVLEVVSPSMYMYLKIKQKDTDVKFKVLNDDMSFHPINLLKELFWTSGIGIGGGNSKG